MVFALYFSEDTDKVYFRKKDEVSDYAEFMFKAKILLNKKWANRSSSSSLRRKREQGGERSTH